MQFLVSKDNWAEEKETTYETRSFATRTVEGPKAISPALVIISVKDMHNNSQRSEICSLGAGVVVK